MRREYVDSSTLLDVVGCTAWTCSMPLTSPVQRRSPPSRQPVTTWKDAGWPMIASRSTLGLSERAHTDAVKSPETDSCTENPRTDSELSPHAKESSRIGIRRDYMDSPQTSPPNPPLPRSGRWPSFLGPASLRRERGLGGQILPAPPSPDAASPEGRGRGR